MIELVRSVLIAPDYTTNTLNEFPFIEFGGRVATPDEVLKLMKICLSHLEHFSAEEVEKINAVIHD